jgi:heavy metal translocating P-type ATPase
MLIFKKKLSLNTITACVVIFALIISGILYFSGDKFIYVNILKWVLFFGALPIIYEILHNIYCKKFGVDLIAGVAIAATFLFGEYLAGLVVLLMLSGGQTLEEYAFNRARRDLSALLSRAPHTAHVKKDGNLVDTPIEEVEVGMVVTIKAGEVVSVDGVVVLGKTTLDESILTGESIPVEKSIGSLVYSGTINTNGTVDVRVTKPAKESKYSHIIALVEEAEKNKAPLVRLADRYSVYFTLITFAITIATWFLKHSITDVLAVLVVATPCPLILATPIAFISGINRAAGKGVIVKNGGSLEKLAEAKTFVFDKTGTLTLGQLEVDEVEGYEVEKNKVLQIAASLDQFSAHTLAVSIVTHVQKLQLQLSLPEFFEEKFGDGVTGKLNGVKYYFGKMDFIKSKVKNFPDAALKIYTKSKDEGKSIVFLSNEEKILGCVVLSDKIREDSSILFNGLRADGINRIIMLTGDKKHVAERIAEQIGITEVYADSLPDDKLNVIKNINKKDRPVVMIGDGINDAPALALSDVGIGLATHGKTATSDSADVVLISPLLIRVRDLLHIARLTLRVAKEGIWIGIGLSIVCMIFASLGFIKPVVGALMQEGIDVLVILNALRVGRGKIVM